MDIFGRALMNAPAEVVQNSSCPKNDRDKAEKLDVSAVCL